MLQTLRLGLTGSESILPGESRTFDNTTITEFSRQGRTVDATLRTDFIASKLVFNISYGVIPQATLNLFRQLYQNQIDNQSFLNFIVSDVNGGTTNYSVKLEAFSFSNRTFKDDWYYSGVSLTLTEV
jgi:hypothetical protein